MLTASENSEMILFSRKVTTERGPVHVWADGLLWWRAHVPASDRAEVGGPGGEPDVDARSWSHGISSLLSDREQVEAFEILDRHLSDLLRDVCDVFQDSSDPLCDAWNDAADLLLKLFMGLLDYYLLESEQFDETIDEIMPLFVQPQSIELCGGLLAYELRMCGTPDHEVAHWVQLHDGVEHGPDPASEFLVELRDVLACANGQESQQILEMHLDAMVQMACHLRFVLNKLRAGMPLGRPETSRIQNFALSLTMLRQEFLDVA